MNEEPPCKLCGKQWKYGNCHTTKGRFILCVNTQLKRDRIDQEAIRTVSYQEQDDYVWIAQHGNTTAHWRKDLKDDGTE